MNFKNYLPLLMVIFLFNACIDETITRKVQTTIPPEFSVSRADLENKIAEIIPSDNIHITNGTTQTTGEPEYKFLIVEIVNPDSFPSNGFTFSNQANEISEIIKENITNIKDYQKVKIEVRNTVEENDTNHTRTYKKEVEI